MLQTVVSDMDTSPWLRSPSVTSIEPPVASILIRSVTTTSQEVQVDMLEVLGEAIGLSEGTLADVGTPTHGVAGTRPKGRENPELTELLSEEILV